MWCVSLIYPLTILSFNCGVSLISLSLISFLFFFLLLLLLNMSCISSNSVFPNQSLCSHYIHVPTTFMFSSSTWLSIQSLWFLSFFCKGIRDPKRTFPGANQDNHFAYIWKHHIHICIALIIVIIIIIIITKGICIKNRLYNSGLYTKAA